MTGLAIDPWADAPLEQDPPANALAPWELEQITDKIAQRKFDDHGLIPEVHAIEFATLSEMALQGNETAVRALRRVHQRADFGGPLSEPHEPSWSLDPERGLPR